MTNRYDATSCMQRLLMIAGAAMIATSCGGEPKGAGQDTSSQPPTPNATSAAGGLSSPAPGAPPAGTTPQVTALGDSIFHGQAAGGMCFTCHGADAKGTPLAPPLVAHQWLTGDGSFAFIQQRVTQGMPTPTAPYAAAMPPMGGASLTPVQVKAVSAYVYSISHS